jgi:exodeoxyribonuclease VII small subunit
LAKEPALPKDIADLSFEDALKELERIVQELEQGKVKLDEAIAAYERGALLKQHCEKKLAEAKMKVEKIQFSPDGSVSSQPADLS